MAPLPTLRGIGTLDNETVLVDLERLGSGGLGSGGLQGEPTVAGPTAVFTDRELTILRYLPTRLTNDEIALSVKHGQGASKKHLRQAGHHHPAGGVTARSPIRTPMSGLAVPSGHHGPADAWFGSRRRLHPWAFPVDPCPIPGGE